MNVNYWVEVSEKYNAAIIFWGLFFIIVGSLFERRGRLNRIKNLKKFQEVKRYRRKRHKIT